MRDLKYIAAYIVPLSAGFSLWMGGGWAWSTVVLIFGVLPLIEQVLPQSTSNIAPDQEPDHSARRFFDWMLYLNVPIVYALAGAYAWILHHQALTTSEWLGMTFSIGIVIGTSGINVAHELGHRNTKTEQCLAQILLLPALYQHFFIEHNRGHHKYVATDQDPASARKGQIIYQFWWKSVVGSWLSAWAIARDDQRKAGRSVWSWQNKMIQYTFFQVLWLSGFAWYGGWPVLAGMVAIAVIGFLLLETVNYIEHYGLRRRLLPTGRPEPVLPSHSWNSNHELGRILLYELTRHSDHHYKATRKYQILRHLDESPQMPLGYPASLLVALVPPVWFWLMNKRVPG